MEERRNHREGYGIFKTSTKNVSYNFDFRYEKEEIAAFDVVSKYIMFRSEKYGNFFVNVSKTRLKLYSGVTTGHFHINKHLAMIGRTMRLYHTDINFWVVLSTIIR